MTASTLRWPLFALIGLLIAVAIALLANRLVSESIGISSEPVTAGESLSPKQTHREHRPHRQSQASPVPTTPTTGSGYTGTVSGSTGSEDSGSNQPQTDDSKPKGNLHPVTPAAPSPAPAPSTGGGSDTSTNPEPGDD
jgi:hypothetical protein